MLVQTDVWEVRDRLNENFQRVKLLLDALGSDADPRVRIEAAAELRHNIALAEKALDTALRVESALIFENAVIETLALASPNLRKEFIRRLNEREQTWRSKYDHRPRTP